MSANLRRGLWLAALLAVAVSLLVQTGYARRETYVWQTLLQMPWITTASQATAGPAAHVLRMADGVRYGPRSFGVAANGQLVVADTFGRRLLWFSPDGTFERVTRIHVGAAQPVQVDDILVSRRGIYLADNANAALWRIGADGQGQLVYSWAGAGGLTRLLALAGDAEGWPAVDLLRLTAQGYRRELRIIGPQGPRLIAWQGVTADGPQLPAAGERLPLPARYESLAIEPSGGFAVVERQGRGRWQLRRFGPRGQLQGDTFLPDHKGWVQLLGSDDEGNLYLGVDLGHKDGYVRKLDRRGQTLWRADVPPAKGVILGIYGRVSAHGDVYLLIPESNGLVMVRWKRSIRWGF